VAKTTQELKEQGAKKEVYFANKIWDFTFFFFFFLMVLYDVIFNVTILI
jgi:hypothetical protein